MLQQTKEEIHPVMQTYGRFPIQIVKGKGSYVWDDKGKKYLDYCAGIATCNLGHVPDAVEKALHEQLSELWHCSNLYHIPTQEKVAKLITEHSCTDQVFFCNSGAEANEAAIKIAKKYGHDYLKQEQPLIITFQSSFHGRTMATLSATGQEKIQTGFTPLVPGFEYAPYNEEASLKLIKEKKPTAVMLELVQGEGGVIPADYNWVQKLAKLCKEQGTLLMIDEIQTGIGRTGTLFAYEQYDIEPDVITLAKALGSGFPIGAMAAKKHVANVFTPGSHGSTFGGNPLAVTAAYTTLKQFVETDVLEQAKEVSHYLWNGLEQLVQKKKDMKQLRGKGLLIGIEVETDAISYVNNAREQHQLLLLVAGPNVVRILPPLTTTKEEVDHFLDILEQLFE